jgi:hypothetical protein
MNKIDNVVTTDDVTWQEELEAARLQRESELRWAWIGDVKEWLEVSALLLGFPLLLLGVACLIYQLAKGIVWLGDWLYDRW